MNAIWQLFVVLPLSVNASRIGEQFFDFLGRLGRLAFYLPLLPIKVDAKFPGILPGALGLSLLGISALVIERLAPTRLKLWRNLTDVFYRCFLAILQNCQRKPLPRRKGLSLAVL